MSYEAVLDLRQSFFHNYPTAKKGKKILDDFLDANDSEGLSKLLRYYSERIPNKETWLRDDVDYFLEYFSLIALADITGYFAEPIPDVFKVEVAYYLGNVSVKRYYSEYYPIHLPEALLASVRCDGMLNNRVAATNGAQSLFHSFQRLNNSINNDDVDHFLWLLDLGEYKGQYIDKIDITGLKRILRNCKQVVAILTEHNKEAEEFIILQGFFQYCEFIRSFSAFLNSLSKKPFLQSAYWHYHSYWFESFKEELEATVQAFFKGLTKQDRHLGQTPLNALHRMLGEEQQYLKSIKNVCNSKKYSGPLLRYLEKLKPVGV